jgi:hypothetical protein
MRGEQTKPTHSAKVMARNRREAWPTGQEMPASCLPAAPPVFSGTLGSASNFQAVAAAEIVQRPQAFRSPCPLHCHAAHGIDRLTLTAPVAGMPPCSPCRTMWALQPKRIMNRTDR